MRGLAVIIIYQFVLWWL